MGRFIHGRRQLPGYVAFQKGTEYAFLGHDAATQDDDLGLQYGDDVAYGDGYVTGQVVNGPEGIGIAFGGHRKDGSAIEFVRADSFGRGDVADQTGSRCQVVEPAAGHAHVGDFTGTVAGAVDDMAVIDGTAADAGADGHHKG